MEHSTATAEPRPSFATRVHDLVHACLFVTPPASEDLARFAEGVVLRIGFDPDALARQRPAIDVLINELVPEEFYAGMSFLNLCLDRQGDCWGQHRDVDMLLCLALASERAEYCAPRELWSILPGGMPYVLFKRRGV